MARGVCDEIFQMSRGISNISILKLYKCLEGGGHELTGKRGGGGGGD